MSAPASPPQRFVLTAPPPVRALAVAAGAALVAIVVVVVARSADLPALTVVATVLLVLAVLWAVLALVLTRRMRTTLVLEAETLRVRQGGLEHTTAWADVTEAGLDHGRLILTTGTGERTTVAIPRGARDPRFAELHAALRTHLDDSRGYGGPAFG